MSTTPGVGSHLTWSPRLALRLLPAEAPEVVAEQHRILLFVGPADGQVHPPVLSATSADKNARLLRQWKGASVAPSPGVSPVATMFALSPSDAARLPEQRAAIVKTAQDQHEFDTALKGAGPGVEGLRHLESQYRNRALTPPQYTALMNSFLQAGSPSDAVRVFDNGRQQNHLFGALAIPNERYMAAQAELGQAGTVLDSADTYLHQRHLLKRPLTRMEPQALMGQRIQPTVLESVGKAFAIIAEQPPTADNLSRLEKEAGHPVDAAHAASVAHGVAASYLQAAFETHFDADSGMASLRHHLQSNTAEGRQRAERLAPMVQYACRRDGGDTSATELQLALQQGNEETARQLLPRALQGLARPSDAGRLAHDVHALGLQDPASASLVRGLQQAARAPRFPPSPSWASSLQSEFELHSLQGRDSAPPVNAGAPDLSDPLTRMVFDKFFVIDQPAGMEVPGNVAKGGAVPDMPMSRAGIEMGRKILGHLGIDRNTSFDTADEKVDAFIQQRFGLQHADGERSLEDLESSEHADFDEFRGKLLEFMATDVSGNSHTNLMLETVLGHGDCRQVAYSGKQALMDIWHHDATESWLQDASLAARRGDTAARDEAVAHATRQGRERMMTASFYVQAPIQTEGKYKVVKDETGHPRPASELNDVENHTCNWKVTLDERGRVSGLELRDSFYQNLYPWKRLGVSDLARLADRGEFAAGRMGVSDSTGAAIPVQGRIAPYSGRRSEAPLDDCGFMRLAGIPVLPPGEDAYLGDRSLMDPIVNAILGRPA